MKKHKGTSAPKREVRCTVAPQTFEIRSNGDGSRSISGYFAVFDTLSTDLGGFREKIAPGAFTASLTSNPDVLCLYGHDNNQILGRVASGTLEVAEDAVGLRFVCRLPNTSTANDLIALLERRDVSACSFGFTCVRDSWDEIGGQIIRTLNEVIVWEGSVVGQPAYAQSSVNLRSIPVSLRRKLKAADELDVDDELDDDEGDDDDTDGDECRCLCAPCEEGDCEACTEDCTDNEDCLGCPSLDDTRSDKLRVRKLFALRRQ